MNDLFEIDCNGHNFRLCFTRPGSWLEEFPSSVKRIIRVYFIPTRRLKENDVLEIFEGSKPILLKKVRDYISEHEDAYKDFEINHKFNEWGFNIDPSQGVLSYPLKQGLMWISKSNKFSRKYYEYTLLNWQRLRPKLGIKY